MKIVYFIYSNQRHVVIDLQKPYFPILIIYGFPYRFSYLNRIRQLPWAIGVSNHFHSESGIMYTWFIDSDKPKLLNDLVKKSILVVKTPKGYHYYLDVLEKSFYRALKRAYRLHKQYGDVYQLRMGLARYRANDLAYLVLRIKGKYYENNEVVYERPSDFEELEKWKINLLKIIN